MKKYNIAIIGATGAVGEELLLVLETLNIATNKLVALASSKSLGKEIDFKGKKLLIKELSKDIFEEENIEIAFFSAGSSISKEYAPYAVKAGALVIDNTSYFRMDENVPLVVPEVNPQDIKLNKGIIANPNCSTIQMLHILKPLDDILDIKRVDVSTYQAVSGAGKKGMQELINQMKDFFNFKIKESKKEAFKHTIALNLIPHIDIFLDNNYTKEEMKMINESRKILHKDIELSATCVRVPVLRSHSEAISIKFNKEVDLQKVNKALKEAENVKVLDEPKDNIYPMPMFASDSDYTYVGRIRKDLYDKNTLHLWCVADQIRVGAATNAVRIAKKWIEDQEK